MARHTPSPFPARQLRRLFMPLDKLVEYLDRKTHELTNARIHNAAVDMETRRLVLHIESEHPKPVPLDFTLNWNDIFGDTVCEVTGKPAFVDDVVCSREGVDRLRRRVQQLENHIIDGGGTPPAELPPANPEAAE